MNNKFVLEETFETPKNSSNYNKNEKTIDFKHEKENSSQNKEKSSSEYLDSLIYDRDFVDSYSDIIENYLDVNDFGAIKTDLENLNKFYSENKLSQCRGYEARSDVESTFMYNFGASLTRAAYKKTQQFDLEPDHESLIEELLEYQDKWYFMDKKTLAMKKGAYDWKNYAFENNSNLENIY